MDILTSIAEVAETQRVSTILPPATGYGTDIICDSDLDALCREEDPSAAIGVARAIFRRLTTPRGGLIDDPEYGFDVNSLLHKAMLPQFEAAIPGIIRNEILKDERVESVDVRWTRVGSEQFEISISGTCAAGPFRLVMQLTDGNAILQELAA